MTGVEIALVALAAVSAVGTLAAGAQAADANKANARLAQQRGDMAMQQAGAQADLQKTATARQLAQARANFAASGIEGEGPLDVLSDQATQGELGRQMILYRGRLGQFQGDAEAANYDRAASAASTSSYFGAATTLLGAAYVGANGYSPSTAGVNSGAAQVPAAMNNISTGVSYTSPY